MKTTSSLMTAALLAAALCRAGGASTITVTTVDDLDAADGLCSLREAILAANLNAAYQECPAGTGADRIEFSLAPPATILLTDALPPVTETVAIRGPGAADLAISGGAAHRILQFDSADGGEWFLLEGVLLIDAFLPLGAANSGPALSILGGETALVRSVDFVENSAGNGGGAVMVYGNTTQASVSRFEECNFVDNAANGAAGGGALFVGGFAEVTVDRSTFRGNRAIGPTGYGGAILVTRSTLHLLRSTLSANEALNNGGGISANSNGGATLLEIVDSTIYQNLADSDLSGTGDGGGLALNASPSFACEAVLENSIVAGNEDGGGATVYDDVSFSTLSTLLASTHNLIGSNEGAAALFPAGAPNAAGDFVGTAAAAIDPLLLPLDSNDGRTPSHRPLLDAASMVIDHGACPDRLGDQRLRGDAAAGVRAYDHPSVPTHAASDGCDIGSVERGASVVAGSELFGDDFELGHALLWSAEAP